MARVPRKYWLRKENVLISARQHRTKNEWQKAAGAAYNSARRNGWFEEATAHMESPRLPMTTRRLDIATLLAIAWGHETRASLLRADNSAYQKIKRLGLDDLCLAHMPWPKGTTVEEMKAVARRYGTRAGLAQNQPRLFKEAQRRGLLDVVCKHMRRSNQ